MTWNRWRSTIATAVVIGSALTGLNSAQAFTRGVYSHQNAPYREANCYRWFDTEDSIRCFDCLRKVWTGGKWQWANVCPRRYFNAN